MPTVLEALDKAAAIRLSRFWQAPALKQFITTGDVKHLRSLAKPSMFDYLPSGLLEALGMPKTVDEHGKRLLQACLAVGFESSLGQWLASAVAHDQPLDEQFDEACQVLRDLGCSVCLLAAQIAKREMPLMREDGVVSKAGRFIIGLSDADLRGLLDSRELGATERCGIGRLLAVHDAARFSELLWRMLDDKEVTNLDPEFWTVLVQRNAKHFVVLAERALDGLKFSHDRLQLAGALEEIDAARYGPLAERLCRDILKRAGRDLWMEARDAALWLVVKRGSEAFMDLKHYLAAPVESDPWRRKNQSEMKNEVLDEVVKRMGRQAIPLLEACFETDQPEVHYHALQLWTGFKDDSDVAAIMLRLRGAFSGADPATVARCVRLAGDWNPAAVEPDLWPLFGHKSRPVRQAVAACAARLGDSRVSKATELWAARRADARLAAVHWLKALATPAAVAELEARLDVEEDDDVRDGILLALESLGGGTAASSLDELRRRIRKTLAKLDGPPVAWLDPRKLPAPKLKDGTKLRPDWLLYLLHRQSRVKEMRPDIEARPLYAQIDRKTSGDLALAVAKAFFGSKLDAADRWTMAFAALVGDDRLVPLLTRQIKEWAEGVRGKLAEYAVQALALLGTDSALLAVDAMAIRYRSKNKNIGKAATEAFAAAAEARGLTTEELGDLVVPWLGFEPGQPRRVDTGKAQIEVRIDNGLKLAFRETATNKKLTKLPDSAPAEVKAEFKEVAASLKEAVKSQLLRLENLMVRQFHWTVGRWSELYLRHPLLIPFAQRLVWGLYDCSGKLSATFRALEDRSLTDALDEPFTLPAEGAVGIVHPLELTPEARQGWLKHLADYDIMPPFAQIERPVVTVRTDQRDLKYGDGVSGTELNAMTFKGRAERLGWTRGSVCDAGGIDHYLKRFPTAGVDAFVGVEGMFIGIDMYSDITLGDIFFVKHGSVEIGSYIYDAPEGLNDPRLVAFGDVPAIAFSEAMSDLAKIAAKSQTAGQAMED